MNQPSLDCTSAHPHLALHAGGDLESALAQQVEAHLAGCANCSAELGRAKLARERIALLAQADPEGLDSLDLWPALSQRLAAERAAADAARASTAARGRPSRLRRAGWFALPLAAAAALLLMFQRGETPLTPPAGSPPSPLPSVELATHLGIETQATPNGLRRAAPGEERLRDSARPLDAQVNGLLRRAAPGAPNALAGDDGLR